MEVIKYKDIKDELLSNFKRKTLLPIIGSGFTRDCSSFKGKVPSGEDYRLYMVKQLLDRKSVV